MLTESDLFSLKDLIDAVKERSESKEWEKELDSLYLSAFECHKKFLLSYNVYKAIALCVALKKYEYIKTIFSTFYKKNDYTVKAYHYLPENPCDTLLNYFYSLKKDGRSLINPDHNEYDYIRTTCLFLIRQWEKHRLIDDVPDIVKNKSVSDSGEPYVATFLKPLLQCFMDSDLLYEFYNSFEIKNPAVIVDIRNQIEELIKKYEKIEEQKSSESPLILSMLKEGIEEAQKTYKRNSLFNEILKDGTEQNGGEEVSLNHFSVRERLLESGKVFYEASFRRIGSEIASIENQKICDEIYEKCSKAASIIEALENLNTKEAVIFAHQTVVGRVLYNDRNFTPVHLLENKKDYLYGQYLYDENVYDVYYATSEQNRDFILVIDKDKVEYDKVKKDIEAFPFELDVQEDTFKAYHNYSDAVDGLYFQVLDYDSEKFKDKFGDSMTRSNGKVWFGVSKYYHLTFKGFGYKITYPR